jgi:multidrug transporter EmrE-like cation transporter
MAVALVILSGIAGSLFTLGYKIKDRLQREIMVFMFYFSLFFTCITFLFMNIYQNSFLNLPALLFGIPNGFSMFGAITMYSLVIKKAQLNISWTVVQFSVLVPFSVSIIFFDSTLGFFSFAGITLILFAITILGKKKNSKNPTGITSMGLMTWFQLFLTALFSGLSLTFPLLYVSLSNNTDTLTLLFYGSCTMVLLSLICKSKSLLSLLSPGRKVLSISLFMSVSQVASLFLFIEGLKHIEGTVAYPMRSVSGLLFVYMFSSLIYKERLVIKEKIGLMISVAGITLITMAIY